jgi:DNA helicase-2/ATP-dependent DNA helicase PcrA
MTSSDPLGSDAAPEALLDGLNPAQRQAVVHRGGPLIVVAGAGSGKTRVLTRRVAHLVATGDARPHEILAITFTNKAADEMRDRVVRLLGHRADGMWVFTFHSACARLLRREAEHVGYPRSFSIYDAEDSRRLIDAAAEALGLDVKRFGGKAIGHRLSALKAALVDPSEAADQARDLVERRVAQVYAEYQRRLEQAAAVDFDDLIGFVVRLFRERPEVLERYRERFRQVLVDEYQDTNHAQNELVVMLGAHGNVCVVGDTDQSIYGWRGADFRNLLDFKAAFPDATEVRLEQNYRSTQRILDAANALIAHNTERIDKALFSDLGPGVPPRRYRALDEADEAAWVAAEIQRLERDEGIRLGEVAVFYRVNVQSRALEEEFAARGIPYRVIGSLRFYDRREVRDVLAYLRVAINPADELALARIANVPRRGLGAVSLERLRAFAREHACTLSEALVFAEEAGLVGRALAGAKELLEVLTDLEGALQLGRGPGELVELVLERTGYLEMLEAEDPLGEEGRVANVQELLGVARSFDRVDAMLEAIALVSDADNVDPSVGAVSLMTLHVAKGLEFDAVFIVGLEEGVFPLWRSLDEPSQLEEERRLCYVGVTRAKRFLYLCHAVERTLFGRSTVAMPSRFLDEMPDEPRPERHSSRHRGGQVAWRPRLR